MKKQRKKLIIDCFVGICYFIGICIIEDKKSLKPSKENREENLIFDWKWKLASCIS